jgi:hypothetical protein
MVTDIKTPRELKARYPYMFARAMPYAFEFPKAWFPAFATLCEEIDALLGDKKRGFRWLQTKEKFGTARYYWKMIGRPHSIHIDMISTKGVVTTLVNEPKSTQPTISNRIGELVRQAQEDTGKICYACGEPGEMATNRSWLLVLCPKHREQDRRGRLKFNGFTDDEL